MAIFISRQKKKRYVAMMGNTISFCAQRESTVSIYILLYTSCVPYITCVVLALDAKTMRLHTQLLWLFFLSRTWGRARIGTYIPVVVPAEPSGRPESHPAVVAPHPDLDGNAAALAPAAAVVLALGLHAGDLDAIHRYRPAPPPMFVDRCRC